MTPRTVVIPGNGTNVLSFTIPAGVDFNVESVVASVDASGAADTTGELAIAEVTGAVIATKRQGLPIPAGDTGTETWALRLTDEQAASTPAGLVWGSGLGEDSAVASGVSKKVSFDAATLITSPGAPFSIDAGLGYTGLGIHSPGFYRLDIGVIFERASGAQPPNPETIVAEADEGGLETTTGMFGGSNYARGFVNVAAHDEWDVGYWKVIEIVSSTGAAPLVVTVLQPSGQSLDTIVSFLVTKLPS